MLRYAKLPMDLADAALVIAAEQLASGRILSTAQRDFGAYRWKNRKPFHTIGSRTRRWLVSSLRGAPGHAGRIDGIRGYSSQDTGMKMPNAFRAHVVFGDLAG